MNDRNTPKATKDVVQLSFEEALQELRVLVNRLEQGEGRLEEAIASYERGALLKAHCEKKLREAQAKIEKVALNPGSNQIEVAPFDEN